MNLPKQFALASKVIRLLILEMLSTFASLLNGIPSPMHFKQSLMALCVASAFMAGQAMAETYPLTVSIEAIVPSNTGLIVSPINDWASKTQTMGFNHVTNNLSPITEQLHLKSGLGDIKAYLSASPVLAHNTDNINLLVTVAGKQLSVGSAAAAVVLTSAEASAGRIVSVDIATAAPATEAGHPAGSYQGIVQMMFESSAPAP